MIIIAPRAGLSAVQSIACRANRVIALIDWSQEILAIVTYKRLLYILLCGHGSTETLQ